MLIYFNGEFVAAAQATISVQDRGFLYGDGLFETIRVADGRLVLWAQHWDRFDAGRRRLGIPLSLEPSRLRSTAEELLQRNGVTEGVLRLQISRGVGVRGYSPRGAERPTLVLTTHPLAPLASEPVRWRLHTASVRLPAGDALAAHKTCNRLLQVLARAEADAAGADDALLLDGASFAVEAASANLFWIEGGRVCTPPLSAGILPGITRAAVLALCANRRVVVRESMVPARRLLGTEGVFVTLSSYGIVEIVSLDDQALAHSPLTAELQSDFVALAQEARR